MPEEGLRIEIKGLDKLVAAFEKFPKQIARAMSQAGHEAGRDVILPTPGLKKYPPKTAANTPPEPYYIRGRGMQYKSGNTGGSERLGTQWSVLRRGAQTYIGNRASYAQWVHGDEQGEGQAMQMGRAAKRPKGWARLRGVVQDKMAKITRVYQNWVDKVIRDLGL